MHTLDANSNLKQCITHEHVDRLHSTLLICPVNVCCVVCSTGARNAVLFAAIFTQLHNSEISLPQPPLYCRTLLPPIHTEEKS